MTYEEFQNNFPIELNQQQSDAVCCVNGPILLLAVPGSGKTTVLVTRLGYMVYCAGIAPESILTLTYTVAAARDMSRRFYSYFGNEPGGRLEFRTINGICAKVIQYYGNQIGKNPFSLVTENEVITRLLSDSFRRIEDSYATESDLKGIRGLITYIKNMMLTSEEIQQLDEETDYKISEIYKAYNAELHERRQMDYDDQMVYAYNILRRSPETLQYFQNQYDYICVDEAQDTSRIQHEIIKLLAGRSNNLFMVGDEDQSIYGFRAAYPEALLSFENDHAGAKVMLMEENFRSDAKIVAAADRFIQKNTLRHEKHMAAVRDAGTDIQRIILRDRNRQYDYLVKVAEACRTQTAVLYRNHESVLPLVDRLERKGIPYRLRNTEVSFFTHRIVLDIRNIIGFAMNPKDTELFLQIYYKTATYMKKQDAIGICELSSRDNSEVLETAIRCGQIPDRTVQNCRVLRDHLKCLRTDRPDKGIDRIIYNMGYGAYLERMHMSDNKLFILKAIAQNENSLQGFIERLDVLQTILQGERNEQGFGEIKDSDDCSSAHPIILSTIHSSKGLEYDAVYLMDVVDGVFPEVVPKSLKAMDQKERVAYEEERRLFYVGVTRAKDSLFVFRLDQSSAFCEELLQEERKEEKPGAARGQRLLVRKKALAGSAQAYASRKKAFSPKEFDKYLAGIGEGLIVRHKKLGDGVVEEVQGDKIIIQFAGERRLLDLRTLYEYDLLIF